MDLRACKTYDGFDGMAPFLGVPTAQGPFIERLRFVGQGNLKLSWSGVPQSSPVLVPQRRVVLKCLENIRAVLFLSVLQLNSTSFDPLPWRTRALS